MCGDRKNRSGGDGAVADAQSNIRVLVVEDNVGFAYFLKDALTRQSNLPCEVESVGTLEDAAASLGRNKADLVLLDLGLPDSTRLATFERIRECDQDAAIIILTVLDDDELAMNALRQGAQDYLVKGEVDAAMLVRSIRYALERTRIDAELRNLSGRLLQLQDAERRRIARELHDGTAQYLAALAMNLSTLQRLPVGQQEKPAKLIADSLESVTQCSRELRTLSYLLHPPLLDEIGLASAVREFTDGFSERSGIRVDLELPEHLGRLPRDVETAVFRVMQECLTNVHKHSDSSMASVVISSDADTVSVGVSDSGRGIPSGTIPDSGTVSGHVGIGIPGMRERLQQLGGQLHIETGPNGTSITGSLPLKEPVFEE